MSGKKLIQYHVFSNNWDDWFDTLKEARQAYKDLVDRFGCARLYKELYNNYTDESVEPDEEWCLQSKGEYPS